MGPRLRKYLGDTTSVFHCPSARPEYKWTPIYDHQPWQGNATFYGYAPNERPLSGSEFFCYGYNGWGVLESSGQPNLPHLGLGGHVAPGPGETETNADVLDRPHREPQDQKVVAPSDMIAIADSFTDGSFDTWITPETAYALSAPGKRHTGAANVLFVDCHATAMKQSELLSTRPEARSRWNITHRPN